MLQLANPNPREPVPLSDAPPKQVSLAMDRLSHATRLIADVRLSMDRILDALFVIARPHISNNSLNLIVKEDGLIKQHLRDLRNVGRKLEESGVLNESLRARSNSWGLHMPLVCPDGAVVAYAWKRQLAGQAGSSAVDRTRLALKAFTDQKRRFFPYLDDGLNGLSSTAEPVSKKHHGSQEKHDNYETLAEVLMRLENEVPNVKIFTHQRLDWLQRATLLPSSADEGLIEPSRGHNFYGSNNLISGSLDYDSAEKVGVIELYVPSIFRAVVSLHPAGSTDPDAIAFFSPDEGGSYVHARGISVFHVFRHITEHASVAMQYFLGFKPETALYFLLHWICSYQSIFTQVCSNCGRLLSMDKKTSVLLPPVHRSYQHLYGRSQLVSDINRYSVDVIRACHIGCVLEEM